MIRGQAHDVETREGPDYIIVGAGSAGCVLASRLSEDSHIQVAVIDAGPDPNDKSQVSDLERTWLEAPALFQYMQDTRLDWGYWMEPQKGLRARSFFVPRGKLIGGTSTFIAGLFSRGNALDYDGWAATGNPSWSFKDVLPLFKRAERNRRPGIDPTYHGTVGSLTVSDLPELGPPTRAFLEACRCLGYPSNEDFNGPTQEGVGVYQFYLDAAGRRVNSAGAYLTSEVRARSNLCIIPNAEASRILFHAPGGEPRAAGVEYLDRTGGGRVDRTLFAKREVIVCGGAINSPKLLLLSGVGPGKHLRALGIPIVAEVPGVGENLQDHLIVPVAFRFRKGSQPDKIIASGIDAGLFWKSDPQLEAPDLQFVFDPAILGPPGPIITFGFQVVPVLLTPHSRGKVSLRSIESWAPPHIDGRYLSDPRDLKVMAEGVRMGLRMLEHPALDTYRGERYPLASLPGSVASQQEIEDHVREFAHNLFHSCGTCKMGPASDPMAVVDHELRVHGVQGLRIVDASIMPTIPRGNTHTPTTMIGEKGADMIRNARQSPSAPAAVSERSFLPATLPAGANPETYGLEAVTRLLNKAAYLSIFSIHDPKKTNNPIPSPSDPTRIIGVEVYEALHRLQIRVEQPVVESHVIHWRKKTSMKYNLEVEPAVGVLLARKRIGQPVASVHIHWLVIPDDFEAAPGKVPPPTELDPTRSQRFAMLDGEMQFLDRHHSGFRAFGTGRTFPVMIGQQPQLRIGAVIDVLEGFGAFKGLPGTIVINGYLTPPQGLALNLMLRFMDPSGKLHTTSTPSPLRAIRDPDPDTAFLVFLGEPDPERPTTLQSAGQGPARASVHELLRLVDINFDLKGTRGPRSRTSNGEIVGSLSGTLLFDPTDPSPITSIQTTDGVFTFFDRRRRNVATLQANIVEGRAFRTVLEGAPMPVFRFGGFGPLLGGTGPFENAVGLMSLNAAISVFPRTLSNLYVLRVSDPDGRFRGACARDWF